MKMALQIQMSTRNLLPHIILVMKAITLGIWCIIFATLPCRTLATSALKNSVTEWNKVVLPFLAVLDLKHCDSELKPRIKLHKSESMHRKYNKRSSSTSTYTCIQLFNARGNLLLVDTFGRVRGTNDLNDPSSKSGISFLSF